MLEMLKDYDTVWAELNAGLRAAEAAGGLSGAIASLELNQRETGFIRDSLFGVERRIFHHPEDRSRYFRIQFNARRLERFNGAGNRLPPEGIEALHGGCFLCRDNVRWQQGGTELGFELEVNGRTYNAWMNPFALMPHHTVVASASHETQDWRFGPNGGQRVHRLIADLATISSRLPGFVGFYNGMHAGASIPGHLHFQFFGRPEDMPEFPLEARLRSAAPPGAAPAITISYPLPVVKWSGSAAAVISSAADWIDAWAWFNADRMFRMSANIVVAAGEDGTITLYFVPRDRGISRGAGMSGIAGGLEILGELVLSSAYERELLDTGAIDYFFIENVLASLRTPLFIDTV